MPINLEQWEINLILNALSEIPYKESGAVIQRIKEQLEPTITHCKDCVWFAPMSDYPETEAFHKKLHELFDGILPPREGEKGICRKVSFCKERPVPTHENGFCHRAKRRKQDE